MPGRMLWLQRLRPPISDPDLPPIPSRLLLPLRVQGGARTGGEKRGFLAAVPTYLLTLRVDIPENKNGQPRLGLPFSSNTTGHKGRWRACFTQFGSGWWIDPLLIFPIPPLSSQFGLRPG